MSDTPTSELRRIGPPGRDYGYSNARIRGMRSRLLKQAFFEDLMSSKDIGIVIQKMMQTEYGPELETHVLHGRTAANVDEALKDTMVSTFRKVLSIANDEAQDLVTTLLGRWDLFNIKTIVRGKHMHFDEAVITDSLVTVGQLTQVDARRLAKQDSVKGVVDTLSTWGLPFAVPLREVMPEYNEEADLSVLELALDRYYYQWAAKRLGRRRTNSRVARDFLGVQVDTLNLLTCLRLLNSDLGDTDAARFFLGGGLDVSKEALPGTGDHVGCRRGVRPPEEDAVRFAY